MDHGQRSTRKTSGRATLSLILLCLFMLLGSPAGGPLETDDTLAPQDTVEIRVSGRSALPGGAAEASLLTDAFTIGTAGSLKLPIIGHVPAAGLRADELAKLISDLLQARSGLLERPVTTVQLKQYPFLERPVTTVQLKQYPSLAVRGSVERPGKYPYRPNLTVQEAIEGAGGLARIAETGTQMMLSISRSVGRVRELTVAWNTLVLPGDILSVRRTPVPETRSARIFTDSSEAESVRKEALAARLAAREERLRTAPLTQKLSAARADLEAVKALAAQQANAVSRARQASEALVKRERELVAREHAKADALEQNLIAARREIDALKNTRQTAGDEREQALHRELMAAREQLDTMRGNASAQARAVADTTALQARALGEQRQRAERLARDLTVAQREVEGLKANAVIAIREKAAARRARHVVEASLAEVRRVLDEERHKVERFERDFIAAHQSIDALEASANRAAAAQAAALQGRQVTETAAKRVGEQLALERERADLVAQDLDGARKEGNAAKQELSRVSAELLAALEQERDKAIGLARDLSAAHKYFDMLKAQDERRTARIERAPPKARATASRRVSMQANARPARQSGSQEIRKVEVRKPAQPVRLTTIVLPDTLLPTWLP